MNYGEMLLSKVVDTANPIQLNHVTERDFVTEAERKAYRFIKDYVDTNRGRVPDFRTLVAEVNGFTYVPNVEDSFDYLTKQIKSYSAKIEVMGLLQNEAPGQFEQLDGNSFLEWLREKVDGVIMRTSVRDKVGTSLKTDTNKFLEEYDRRKKGESYRIWKSRFSFINKAIGGYVSSNVYTIYGKSGRGKSATTIEEGVEMAFQGANVLIWLMEMGWFEGMVRLYTSISSRIGATVAELDGVNLEAGFDSKEIRHGKLSEEFEKGFKSFLANINEILPGNIIVRGVDDDDFHRRDLRQLEVDITETNADVVIVDPFYYLDYEKNTSKTAGGDAAETSKRLRRLAGKTGVVMFAITQADEVDNNEDEDGQRELRLPKRSEVKKTKALLEDAALLIAVDTDAKQGRGMIGINKGRDGGEGESAEIIYMPQIGVIKEMETGEHAAEQFTLVF
ncbi:DNA helicase [Bacillus cereus]|uniref:DnaB-like helicase C-terminal domain-containing protein n=1 Tax=Bacillus cereus TaxID=1396 RepID=UPI000BF3BA72|nr:DnaB-like helicase C-terminal domain-containing protein [Bacillus cereus]PFJ29337.1 DNA helicase [Bacillus cereus]PFO23566.1 DNA helicase [Bacillus cereus]PGN66006.1 DNA helicase [Bacillus cereus]